MERLSRLEVRSHETKPFGPDTCPVCGTSPYPSGTCESCGFTRPPGVKHRMFSDNNLPPLIGLGILAFFICVGLFAVFFSR